MKISKSVSELLSGHDFQNSNFQRGKFLKTLGGVIVLMVLVLCTLSDHAVYLNEVS